MNISPFPLRYQRAALISARAFICLVIVGIIAALTHIAAAESTDDGGPPRFGSAPASPSPAATNVETLTVLLTGELSDIDLKYPYFSNPAIDRLVFSSILTDVTQIARSGENPAALNPDIAKPTRSIEYNMRDEGGGIIVLTFYEKRSSGDGIPYTQLSMYSVNTITGALVNGNAANDPFGSPKYVGSLTYVKTTPAPQKTQAPTGGKVIALTFDDGPSVYTSTLLNVLRANGAKATFFVLGERVSKNTNIVKQAVNQGCEVVGHSWDHADLTKLSESAIRDELLKTRNAIERATGVRTYMYRAPYGSTDSKVRRVSSDLGMGIINWSVDTEDWKYKNSDRLYSYIMNNVSSGSIILCHDIHKSTVEAMRRIIPELVKRGYKLVTVSELMGFNDARPTAGKVYYNR